MDGHAQTEHTCNLAERIGNLLYDEKTSDVVLIVEGEYLPAHRAILSVSSEYFRALLYGNMKESIEDEVVLKDVPLRGFKLLMKYVYTGNLGSEALNDDSILEVLGVAHLYGFHTLVATLCRDLKQNLSIDNVCLIYSKAHLLNLKELRAECHDLMFLDPEATLQSATFCDLTEPALFDILSQDTFCAAEIEVFEALLRWKENNATHSDLSRVFGLLRLPLIDSDDLFTTVLDSKLIPPDRLVGAMQTKIRQRGGLQFRGYSWHDVNIASPDFGALKLTEKDRGDYVTSRTCCGYDSEDMPPDATEFNLCLKKGLTIALKKPFFANHISFRFCEDSFRCSYYIECSFDLVDWIKIIDHSQFACRSLQRLFFEPRVLRYIRLVPSDADANGTVTKLSSFKVVYVDEPFEVRSGFYVPRENVASVALGASVFRSLDGAEGLISEETSNDPDQSNWTSHEIGKGSITIRLPQPYIVGSMRMLLRSDESRAYLYYIETCSHWGTWNRVADHTENLCRSWQDIVFEPHLVRYIRIVGTGSTAGELFSCARFECPAQPRNTARADGSAEQNVLGGMAEGDA